MNYILIFKNNQALQDEGIDTSNLIQPVTIDNETIAYLYDDSQTCDETKEQFTKELADKNNTFYVVLHNRTQNNSKDTFKGAFGQNVITQSHTPGDFYFTIIPKLIDNTCTLEDIKKFFLDPTIEPKLRLLHKLLGNDCELNDEENQLVTYYEFDLQSFQAKPDMESLRTFRNKLLDE